jgi:hypothetical protein
MRVAEALADQAACQGPASVTCLGASRHRRNQAQIAARLLPRSHGHNVQVAWACRTVLARPSCLAMAVVATLAVPSAPAAAAALVLRLLCWTVLVRAQAAAAQRDVDLAVRRRLAPRAAVTAPRRVLRSGQWPLALDQALEQRRRASRGSA